MLAFTMPRLFLAASGVLTSSGRCFGHGTLGRLMLAAPSVASHWRLLVARAKMAILPSTLVKCGVNVLGKYSVPAASATNVVNFQLSSDESLHRWRYDSRWNGR